MDVVSAAHRDVADRLKPRSPRCCYRSDFVPFAEALELAEAFLPLMMLSGFFITPLFLLPGYTNTTTNNRSLSIISRQ